MREARRSRPLGHRAVRAHEDALAARHADVQVRGGGRAEASGVGVGHEVAAVDGTGGTVGCRVFADEEAPAGGFDGAQVDGRGGARGEEGEDGCIGGCAGPGGKEEGCGVG